MHIMTAGMHDPFMFRSKIQIKLFKHWQGIHVPSQEHYLPPRPCRQGSTTTQHHGDRGLPLTQSNLQPLKFPNSSKNRRLRLGQVQTNFRDAVEFSTEVNDLLE